MSTPLSRDATPRLRLPNWLVTFADIIALLLAFFIMLFATQRVERSQWEALVQALSRTSDSVQAINPTPKANATIGTLATVEAIDLSYLQILLEDGARRVLAVRDATLRRHEDRLVLALPSDLLFPTGSAVITETARSILFEVSGILQRIDNQIAVHGHTDPRPVSGSGYASNWHLSIARATAVARYLKQGGYRRDPAALGLAATRFFEVSPDLPADRAFALARRVDIVIYQYGWVRR